MTNIERYTPLSAASMTPHPSGEYIKFDEAMAALDLAWARITWLKKLIHEQSATITELESERGPDYEL